MSAQKHTSVRHDAWIATSQAWKAMMVHASGGDDARASLDAAAALASDLGAILIGVGAETIPPMVYADPFLGASEPLVIQLRDQLTANLDRAATAFRDHTAGIRREWIETREAPTVALTAFARSCDLIICAAAPDGADPNRRADPAGVALDSGRPVLVPPREPRRLRARKVVVGWKDTRETRRAVADALPLLKDADEVLILAACRREGVADATRATDDVVGALARHGVTARAKVLERGADRVAELLEREAEVIGADLIVAGCYGRSRASERVFGGVTRDLLREPRGFLLLSH